MTSVHDVDRCLRCTGCPVKTSVVTSLGDATPKSANSNFGWWRPDTTPGAGVISQISTEQIPPVPCDKGSLKLSVPGTTPGTDKADVEGSFGLAVPANLNIFSDNANEVPPTGVPTLLGTLGQLSQPGAKITVDMFAVGPLTTVSYPAVRLFCANPGTSGQTPTEWVSLVWENRYQVGGNLQSAINQWITVDMTTAVFWQKKYDVPRLQYQGAADTRTLAQWAAGAVVGTPGFLTPVLTPNTGVYYMQASLGTNIATPTTAYIDNPTLTFNSPATYTANFEPAP